MKKIALAALMLMIPVAGKATITHTSSELKIGQIPARFSSMSETSTLEWGCPVAERVQATSPAEAIQKIKLQCIEQVRQAAQDKPEVVEVIQTSVVWPDLSVSQVGSNGYLLNGTFFLNTLVLQKSK